MPSEMSNFDGLPLSREMQDLQNRFNTMMQRINSNSKVAAFVNSSLGQYLDEHPFLAVLLIVFTIMSAVPVGLFLIFAVITSLLACIGFIVMEGVILSVGGVILLCFLCGMILISLAISCLLAMCYFTFSTTMNYYHSSSIPSKKEETIISSTTKLCPEDTASKSTLKEE